LKRVLNIPKDVKKLFHVVLFFEISMPLTPGLELELQLVAAPAPQLCTKGSEFFRED
jgi:hypothetical protein